MIFEVLGKPTGKARARTYYDKRSRSMRSVTPEKTKSYEDLVRWSYKAAGGEYLGDKAIEVHIQAMYEIPKSFNKKQREAAINEVLRPKTKPDVDNIAKSVLDALNGVAYKDDSQVILLQIEKYYTTADARVRVIIN